MFVCEFCGCALIPFVAWPTKRFRSARIGIAVHSVQSVFIILAVLALVAG